MKSHKYIGLTGIIGSVALLFIEIGYQHSLSRILLIILIAFTLYLGILSWNYTMNGDLKNSVMPALKVTLILVGISLVLGLLKRFIS
jgi:TRAP-type C4-dicarboxylate transport system permease small subunit